MRSVVIAILRRADLLDGYFSVRRRRRGWASASRSTLVRSRLRRRIGDLPPGHVWAQVGSSWWVARAERTLRTDDVRIANLERVHRICTSAGVAHFLVPTGSTFRTAIGVPADQRRRVLAALGDLVPEPNLYVVAHDQRSFAEPWGEASAATRRRVEEGAAIDVFTCHASPAGDAPIGRDHRCTLQFWDQHRDRDAADTQDDGTAAERPSIVGSDVPVQLRSPVANRIASSMGRDRLTSSEVVVGGIELATAPEFRWFQRGTEPPFPIDVVYTWVDGDDPEWRRRRDRALGVAASTSRDGSSSERYRSFDELRYSMRSLWQNVAWVGTIHLVTDRQVPAWLDVDHERIRVVDHTEIFGDPAALPTFNSHAIESQLHHIDGLAEHYLYLNDDVFFGRPADWSTYVDRSGRTRFFPSKARFEPRDPSPFETSVDNAGKNLQQHLFAVTGWAPTTKIKHTPHPQQRSLLYEMEEVFADAFKETSLSRFRSTGDISFAAAMHHRYGEAIGRTQMGTINYQYLNLSGPNLSDRLDALLGSPFDTLCLNDGDIPPGEHEAVRARVEAFLRRRFPYAAPWELDADAPASSPRTPTV